MFFDPAVGVGRISSAVGSGGRVAVLVPGVDEFGDAPAWRCDLSSIDSTAAFSGIRRVEVQPEDVLDLGFRSMSLENLTVSKSQPRSSTIGISG